VRDLCAGALLPAGVLVLRRLLPQADALHPAGVREVLLRRLLPQADAVHLPAVRAVLLRRLLPQADAGLVLPAVAAGRLLRQGRHGVREESSLGRAAALQGFQLHSGPSGRAVTA
jgi:hypothetical protein